MSIGQLPLERLEKAHEKLSDVGRRVGPD
ncbi:mCG140161 [Mus musculus]|nr:mCG140161 [Mus musculus]